MSEETHEYHVRRSEVFNDLMRETKKRAFPPFKQVQTYFVGEAGQDRALQESCGASLRDVQQSLCEGKEHCKVLRHDAYKLQVITTAIMMYYD